MNLIKKLFVSIFLLYGFTSVFAGPNKPHTTCAGSFASSDKKTTALTQDSNSIIKNKQDNKTKKQIYKQAVHLDRQLKHARKSDIEHTLAIERHTVDYPKVPGGLGYIKYSSVKFSEVGFANMIYDVKQTLHLARHIVDYLLNPNRVTDRDFRLAEIIGQDAKQMQGLLLQHNANGRDPDRTRKADKKFRRYAKNIMEDVGFPKDKQEQGNLSRAWQSFFRRLTRTEEATKYLGQSQQLRYFLESKISTVIAQYNEAYRSQGHKEATYTLASLHLLDMALQTPKSLNEGEWNFLKNIIQTKVLRNRFDRDTGINMLKELQKEGYPPATLALDEINRKADI